MEKEWKEKEKSGIYSFIYSLNQPVFPEHLLYVRLCCSHWGYSKEQNRHFSALMKFIYILMRRDR